MAREPVTRSRAQILRFLSGHCFEEKTPQWPVIFILSPLIGDVTLEIDEEIYKMDKCFYGLDYGIKSINLPYALLLLKLYGTDVNLITLAPTEANYGEKARFHRRLLDFLDEIGCNIHVNPCLQSKLILSNDLALIGSFDLSKPALYDTEELGIIDDTPNLRMLKGYAHKAMSTGTPYGFTVRARKLLLSQDFVTEITRGWLFEELVKQCFNDVPHYDGAEPDSGLFKEFVLESLNREAIYDNEIIGKVAADLTGFYVKAILRYLNPQQQKNIESRLHYLKDTFDYRGEYKIGEILNFLSSKLARGRVPEIPSRIDDFSDKKLN